jgi:subtilisin family serine protease
MRLTALRVLATLGLAVALATTLASAQAGAASSTARYIVQLTDPPLASYRGGIPGLAATNPAARGAVKLDPTTAASKAYLDYLASKQASVRSALQLGIGRAITVPFTYRYAYNGFAAVLTEQEAAAARSLSGVAQVQKEFTREPQTDAGPAWIGAPGIWSGGDTGGLPGTKGEGIVVGVIDTGINHDHPSFADKGGDGYDHTNPRGTFYGLCDPVLGAPFCNDKLIGVWDFTGTSPEDDNEHGSHTASTSVGNAVSATLNAPTLSLTRSISGVAPHANLITYKACTAAGCLSPSLTAAIDQATADGVDVINYSIGGGPTDPWDDADSDAFLGARDAGVFVSVSAGNDGPRAETVGSPANSPWVLSVGASTHNRAFVNALTSMSGGAGSAPADLHGRSFTAGYGPAKIVYAGNYGSALCGEGPAAPDGSAAVNPFLPGTFHGEIVVCDRGVYGRVEKASNVAEAGAGGYVLANDEPSGGSLIGDAYPIPGVHLTYSDGIVLKDWLAQGSGHTAKIAGTTADTSPANGDIMASFSSRGPNKPAPDVLKPDITAPGVDILAAIHTTNPLSPPEFGVLSGTSMSSPHMTGSAALVRALHPDWTPAEVQSALMTTALNTGVRKEDGLRPADAFDMGSGRVDLTKAGRAGFVLDEQTPDYVAANPTTGGDPTTLNLASLADADCDGSCTWTRTLRGTTAATWTVKTTGTRGLKLVVTPARFTLAAGSTQTVTVTADVKGLPVGKYAYGQVILSSAEAPAAHLPVVVLPGGAPDPVGIQTTSSSGSAVTSFTSPIPIKSLQSRVYGLTKGTVETRLIPQDPTPLDPYDTPVGTETLILDVPAGSRFLATAIEGTTALDIDLYVGLDQNRDGVADPAEEVCASASDTAFESCNLANPAGGSYWVLVQNWAGTGANDVDIVASVVPGTNAGNLTVSGPATAPANTPFDVTLRWNVPTMAAGETWFALVELGSDKKNPSNAGSLFVKIARTG